MLNVKIVYEAFAHINRLASEKSAQNHIYHNDAACATNTCGTMHHNWTAIEFVGLCKEGHDLTHPNIKDKIDISYHEFIVLYLTTTLRNKRST